MLNKINEILSTPFASKEELLAFYQKELPKRIGDFRLDEVGPIMSVGSDEEIAGYLENKFYFNGVGVEMGNDIDWYAAADGDLEWNGGFVRQGYFMYLADAYEKTGDEKYAACIVNHMVDYIKKVPPFDPEGKPYLDYKKSTWRPFEAAGRAAENWPVAFAKIMNSKSMTADAWETIFYSIYQHTIFLSVHHWRTGNHACLECAGLGVLCCFFPEFKEAEKFRKYAIDFLMGMFDEQFHKDGYTKEMSGAYHWIAMRNFFAFYKVGVENGFKDIFPANYVDVLVKAGYAELYHQKPDYSLPITNDSNVSTRHKTQLTNLYPLINPDMIKYRLTEGKEGTKPDHTSYFFDDARMSIMRSDWTEQAVYASFDMGRWGDNHMNEDQLNLEVSAFGRNLLANCGRWRYTTSPNADWIPKAQYFKTTASYNCCLANGLNQVPGDAQGTMKISDTSDYACGVYSDGFGVPTTEKNEAYFKETGRTTFMNVTVPGSHTREVYFAKPDFFVVKDVIKGDKVENATQIWHMVEGDITVDGNVTYSKFDDANFVMIQLGDVKTETFKGSEDPFKGWNSFKYDYMFPAPEMNYTKEGKGEVVFETLIFPVKGAVDTNNLPTFTKEGNDYKVTYQGKTTTVTLG